MTKTPLIYTNEAVQNQFVRIKTNIVVVPDSTQPIIISPYKLEFVEDDKGLPTRAEFKIKNVSSQPLVPFLISSPEDLATVVLPKIIKPGKSATGLVALKKDQINISFDRSFTIELSDPNHTRFTVPIRVALAPKVVLPSDRR